MKFKLTNNEDLVLEKNSESINVIQTLKTQPDWNQTTTTAIDYIKNKPTISTVNNATITIKKNNTTIDSFTTNQSSNKSINITVPTDSDIANIANNRISNLTSFMYTGAVFKDLDSLISTMNNDPGLILNKEYVFLSGISKDRYFPNSVYSFGLPSNNTGISVIKLGLFINTYFTENDWLVLKLVDNSRFIVQSIIPSTYLSRNNESLLPKNLILNETREICLPVQHLQMNDGDIVFNINYQGQVLPVYYDLSTIKSIDFKEDNGYFVFNQDFKFFIFVFDNEQPENGYELYDQLEYRGSVSYYFNRIVQTFGSNTNSRYEFYVIVVDNYANLLCQLQLDSEENTIKIIYQQAFDDKITEQNQVFYLKSSSDGVNGELLDVSLFGNGFYCHPTVRYINDTYQMYTNLTKTDLQNIQYCTIKYSFKKLYNNNELLFIVYSEYPTLMAKAAQNGFYINNNLYIKVKYAPINTTLEHSGTNEYYIGNVVGNCVYLVFDEFQTLLDIISYNYIHNNGSTNLSLISDYYNNEIKTNKSKNLRFYLCEVSSENGVNRIAYTKQYIKFDSNTNQIELVNIPENTNN